MSTVLSVKDLVVEFNTDKGVVRAVDGVSFDVAEGETLGIVGESGCGKSVTSLAIMQLIPIPPGRIASGEIIFNGENLLKKSEARMRRIRGNSISMIFQEPMTALNPVLTVRTQLTDVLRLHKGLSFSDAVKEAVRMLETVGIPEPKKRLKEYPHQLSGGMRQRVMIAMALACNPKILIADEPTTALDVTIQAQVIEQINLLKDEFKMAVMLVTHDLGVIAETCRDVIVMYCGKIVEHADVRTLFRTPRHPYTAGLLASIPRITEHGSGHLPIIKGMVPDLLHLPKGCRFADRCGKAEAKCRDQEPALQRVDAHTAVACFYPN